jgi:hypothetical protein
MVERGAPELTLHSGDPAGTVTTLTQELTQDGAGVQSVQINDTTWTLSINIPPAASGASGNADIRDRVRRRLTQHGVTAPDADSLSIVVESTPRH